MNRAVFFTTILAHETWARVHLNGLPLYKSPFVGPDSRSGPANYLLLPGTNEISVELLRIEKREEERIGDVDLRKDAIKVQLYGVNNPDAPEGTKLDRAMILDVEFPKVFDEETAPEFQRYPFHYRTEFEVEGVSRPLFADAPAAEFGCEGTPELHDAVRQIYGCLERGDYDGFLDELSLKFQCDEMALKGVSDAPTAGDKKQMMRDDLFPYEPRPTEPLDPSLLHFHPLRGGSVAHVTRFDDQFVLDIPCQKDPRRRIRTDLLLMQHEGRWRVFA
ncbi:MAG: hypothetical protein R3B72_06865 [Polyangiaceae bacterium]